MFLIYLKISALKKGFLKEMEVISVSTNCFDKIVQDRFVHHGISNYKINWTPVVGEKLTSVMESNNLMDEYAVAVKRSDESIVGHIPLEKSEKLCRLL